MSTSQTPAVEPTEVAAPEPLSPGAGVAAPRGLARLGRLGALRDYAVLVSFVGLFVALSVSSEQFLTRDNMLNLLDQSTTIGIIAVAGTLIIIAGGFDLSAGAVYALGGVIAADLATSLGPTEGIILGLVAGAALGLLNGLLITAARINAFIATLATSIVFRGVALAISGGFLISVSDEGFTTIGTSEVLGVRLSTWIFLIFAGVLAFVLNRTTFGRYIFACGGNEEAARLSGVRVGAVRTATFVIGGFAAALAGILVASRIGSGAADAGLGLELTAVAAIVVGGTSIWGGEGAIWRTIVGVLFLGLIQNGFNLLSIDPLYQQIVQGSIILIAAGVDAHARRRTR